MTTENVDVSPIPDADFHALRLEISAMPLRKRAKWHGMVQDANGVIHRVHFIGGEFVFKHQSKLIRLVPMTQCQMADDFGDVGFDEPGAEDQYRRVASAHERGGAAATEQEMTRMMNEAATGNHRSKPHKVRVPTGPGEPVRG
jgi:hypothetical protein